VDDLVSKYQLPLIQDEIFPFANRRLRKKNEMQGAASLYQPDIRSEFQTPARTLRPGVDLKPVPRKAAPERLHDDSRTTPDLAPDPGRVRRRWLLRITGLFT
jgi:hypothetical protein